MSTILSNLEAGTVTSRITSYNVCYTKLLRTSIEVTVPASKLESMVDKTFYLGDIITVKLEEIGVIANYRVIQITERYFPSNSGTVQLTLGTLNYTVYDGIKYKLKNASVTSLL